MFTGLIETAGTVSRLEPRGAGAVLVLEAPAYADQIQIGESIAVNGCCLTATSCAGSILEFELLEETLRRTNLGALKPGLTVNLERALAANGRLGGHFVQGHVDGVSTVVVVDPAGADRKITIALPSEFARYVAFKGSIAVNGVSLTVAELATETFSLWIIPHTAEQTNIGRLAVGDQVNLEFDILAKYAERILGSAVSGER